MSVERDIQTPSGTRQKLTSEMTKSEYKAYLNVEVLDRSIINDRLNMSGVIPPDLHGEWVHVDDIEEKQLFGFTVNDELAKLRGIHNDGTGRSHIGDVVFMTCPKHFKEALDESRQDRYNKINGIRGGRPIEESNVISEVAQEVPEDYVKLTNNSSTSVRAGDDLKSQIPKE